MLEKENKWEYFVEVDQRVFEASCSAGENVNPFSTWAVGPTAYPN